LINHSGDIVVLGGIKFDKRADAFAIRCSCAFGTGLGELG
jgi:hypothetical protein